MCRIGILTYLSNINDYTGRSILLLIRGNFIIKGDNVYVVMNLSWDLLLASWGYEGR